MLLRQKVSAVAIVSILAVTGITIILAGALFRQEITSLGRQDYGERIRNIEYEYGSVDTVSAASDDVASIQNNLLNQLKDKYIHIEGLSSYPFIVNGDGTLILYIDGSAEEKDFFASEHVERIFNEQNGDFQYSFNGEEKWVIFSHYEEWDWYTGYFLKNENRFAVLKVFNRTILLSTAGIVVLIWIILIIWLRRHFTPLATLQDATRLISDGGLSVRIPVQREDEIGRTGAQFNRFVEELSGVMLAFRTSIHRNRETEESLRGHTENATALFSGIRADTKAISVQVSELEGEVSRSSETADGIHTQISHLSREISKHRVGVDYSVSAAKKMSDLLSRVGTITEENNSEAEELLKQADRGSERLGETTRAIRDVAARVEDIGELLTLIRGIADQTNMLSMNAAIEAAHAGEAGKGFAVVADEIRKLASDAAENSRSIAEVIENIIKRIEDADKLGHETEKVFTVLVGGVNDIGSSLREIGRSADSARDESSRLISEMEELNHTITRIEGLSKNTTGESEQIMDALQSLRQIASTVSAAVEGIQKRSDETDRIMENVADEAGELKTRMGELSGMMERYRFNGDNRSGESTPQR